MIRLVALLSECSISEPVTVAVGFAKPQMWVVPAPVKPEPDVAISDMAWSAPASPLSGFHVIEVMVTEENVLTIATR